MKLKQTLTNEKIKVLLNPAFMVFSLVMWAIWLYWSTLSPLQEIWAVSLDTPYSHGFFMLGIAVFIFIAQWRSLGRYIRLQISLNGILLVLAVSFIWLLAKLGNIQVVQLLSFLLLLAAILYALFGWRITWLFSMSLWLLLLVMPIFGEISYLLQTGTALAVDTLLNLTGLPAFLDGFLITIPAGVFEVSVGCSGINQFVVGVTLAVLMSWFNKMVPVAWVINIVSIALIAFVANILRVFIIIWMGQITSMQHYFITVEHVSLGWVLFLVGFFIYLFLTNRLFPDKFYDYKSPLRRKILRKDDKVSTKSNDVIMPLLFVAVAFGPAVYAYTDNQYNDVAKVGEIDPVLDSSVWKEVVAATDEESAWSPVIQRGDVVLSRSYVNDSGVSVTLYISYFFRQEQGKEAVSDSNSVYDGKSWRAFEQKRLEIGLLSDGDRLTVVESHIKSLLGKERIVWSWYFLQDRRLANPYMAKGLNTLGMLWGRPEIAVFVLSTEKNVSYEESSEVLRQFVVDNLSLLEREINGIRNLLLDI